jgi:hypothetical protein
MIRQAESMVYGGTSAAVLAADFTKYRRLFARRGGGIRGKGVNSLFK